MAPGGRAETGPVIEQMGDRADLSAVLSRCGLSGPRPVLVSVGGAGGMSDRHLAAMSDLLRNHILPLLATHGAAVVDGGTNSGVMRVMGQARRSTAVDVPLIGVAAAGTVRVPGRPSGPDAAELEPHHTAILIVPGSDWGDESPWISCVAVAVAAGAPSATVLMNGGEIAYEDVRRSVAAKRPVVVVAGTGRTADALAAALGGDEADPRAADLVRSGLVRAVDVEDGAVIAELIEQLLSG